MRRLIVNADDLGLSGAVNDGIFEAHKNGIVGSATCLVTLEGWEDAVARLAVHYALDVGLHLNLTWGRPAHGAALPSLAPKGRFRGKRGLAVALSLGRVSRDELRAEIAAQLQVFTDRLGAPSHVDVHQHLHAFEPVWETLVEVAREAQVPWLRFPAERASGSLVTRWVGRRFRRRNRPPAPTRTTDHFRGIGLAGRLDEDSLLTILRDLPDGLTELMTHPGGPDPSPTHPDRLAGARRGELGALTAASAREAVDAEGIILTTFSAEAARAE